MANDLNRSVKIYIDNSAAVSSAKELEDTIANLQSRLQKLQSANKGNTEEAKKIKSELDVQVRKYDKYKTSIADTERVLKNLSGSTYKELLRVKKEVDAQLAKTTRGTDLYTERLKVHNAVCQEINKVQSEMKSSMGSQATTMDKLSSGFNKYIGIIGGSILTITGVISAFKSLSEEMMKVEESKADVKALTGLDDASVEWLTNQAKKLSSSVTAEGIRIRQSVTEILEAYKLVGSAKPELLTDKEGLAEVTKQTMILASASGMELKDAVDAVTLSLNQYGAGANEAAKYVNILAAGSKYGSAAVESETSAIVKSGVAASSAKVPMEQLVGSIETLAEKGIKDEVAGTGLKKFFITLQTGAKETNPAIVGLDKALENLQKQNLSAAAMKDMFGEEGYNVASVMINSAEKVKYYTQAVTDTNVAVEQAQIKSQTLAAKLAQAKNRFTEIGVELVEKLHPAMTSGINLMSKGMNILISLISFFEKYGKDILIVTGAIAAYTVAVNTSVIVDKLKVLWSDKIVVSLKNMYAVMLKNPYAVVGALILTWILYMKHAHEELTNIQIAQKAVNNVESEAQQNIAKQKVELESLLAVAKDEKKSKDDRLAAIKKLNEISPEYLGNLTLDKINTTEAKKAVDKYVESIYNMAKAQAAKDRIVEIEKQKIKLDTDPEQFNELIPTWQKWGVGFVNSFSQNLGNKLLGKIVEKGRETRDKLKSQLDAEEAALKKMIADSTTAINNDNSTASDTTKEDTDTSGDQMTEKEKKKAAAAAKRAAAAAKKEAEAEKKAKLDEVKKYIEEKKELLEKDYNQGIITQTQYNARMYQLEIENLNRQLAAYGVNSSKRKEIEKKIVEYKNKILELGFQEFTKNMEKEAKKEKEEKARRKKHLYDLNNDLQKSSQQATQIYENENEKRRQQQEKMTETVKSYAEEIGNIIGGAISGNNDLVKSSIVAIINMGLDALEVTAEMAAAEAVIKGGGQAGLAGLAKGAIVAGIIKAAFTTVKALVSSMVYNIGGNSSTSTSGESTTQNTGQYVVNGYAVGGYTGNGNPFQIAGPAHFNEYVVPSFVLSEPKAMNYVSALESMRQSKTLANNAPLPTRGFAEGGYTGDAPDYNAFLNNLYSVLVGAVKNIHAYVVYKEIEDAGKTLDKSKSIGGK